MDDKSVIYVGKKPFSNYITAAMMQAKEGSKELIIRARGKMISKAVDLALALTDKYLEADATISNVNIESELIKDEERETKVSCVDIYIQIKND